MYYYTKPGRDPIMFPYPHPHKEVNTACVCRVVKALDQEMQEDENDER